jgi:excisionase family DNA binding protein
MTTKEVASSLGVTVRAVNALIARGRIPATKVGRDWNISKRDLQGLKDDRKGETK